MKTILKKKFFAIATIAVMVVSLMLMVIPQVSATWTYVGTYNSYDRGWENEGGAGLSWHDVGDSWAYSQVENGIGYAAGSLNSEEQWYSGDDLGNTAVKVNLYYVDISWDPPAGSGWVGLEMRLYVRGTPVGTTSISCSSLSTTMNSFYFWNVAIDDGDWLDFDITAKVDTGGTTQTVNIAVDYGNAYLYVDT